MRTARTTRIALYAYGALIIAFLTLPLVSVGFASVSRARYLSFPIRDYSAKWYDAALTSGTVRELLVTSLWVAALVTALSVIIAFFGALAFARYSWRYRSAFQKLVLLPIFFPQTVLGLALLMWFNALGIVPSWKTAVVAHLVWIAPITTLIVAISAYRFDPALEDAARDMGARPWQVLTQITLPLLRPGLITAGLFAFLLSWGNFPLSLFTTGADATLPEWLYAKMVSGYSPLVPAVGILSVAGACVILCAALLGRLLLRRRG